MIAVYVNDMNLIRIFEEFSKTTKYLKEFEVKDLSKTKIYLGLWLKHKDNGIFVHQSAYTERVRKRFNMDKTHSLSILMVVRSLEPQKEIGRASCRERVSY